MLWILRQFLVSKRNIINDIAYSLTLAFDIPLMLGG